MAISSKTDVNFQSSVLPCTGLNFHNFTNDIIEFDFRLLESKKSVVICSNWRFFPQ